MKTKVVIKPEVKEAVWVRYLLIFLIAISKAAINEIFVYPNDFAPAGISGVATMIQYALGIRVGWFNLAINIPIVLLASKHIDKSLVSRGLWYVVTFSFANIVFRTMDFTGIAYIAKDAGEKALASIAAGVIGGAEFATCVRLGGNTGGTDFISAWVRAKNPQYDLVWINFSINAVVVGASFFVYGYQYTSVICCLIYLYVSSTLSDYIFKGLRAAVKFEVFTNDPEGMSKVLMTELRHGCTLVNATGMYKHQDLGMLICVVNKNQIVDFQNIIASFPGSFAIISSVNSTYGNFKKIK